MSWLFSLWLSFNALASVSDTQLEMLIGSKSVEELREAISDAGSLESFAQECELELQLKRIPVGCFSKLQLMKNKLLISSNEHDRQVQKLSSLCRIAARESRELDLLATKLKSETLSVSCRKAVRKRFDDLDYQLGEVRELDRFLK